MKNTGRLDLGKGFEPQIARFVLCLRNGLTDLNQNVPIFVSRLQIVGKAVFRKSTHAACFLHQCAHFRHPVKQAVVGFQSGPQEGHGGFRNDFDQHGSRQAGSLFGQITVYHGDLSCEVRDFCKQL